MILTLIRSEVSEDGVFGELLGESGERICYTLEHAYGGAPKLPAGTYCCVRGKHRLHSMIQPFETFEITGVPGHSNILFHCGNTQADSEGCVLVGLERAGEMILNSRVAFEKLMELVAGTDRFELSVQGPPETLNVKRN